MFNLYFEFIVRYKQRRVMYESVQFLVCFFINIFLSLEGVWVGTESGCARSLEAARTSGICIHIMHGHRLRKPVVCTLTHLPLALDVIAHPTRIGFVASERVS